MNHLERIVAETRREVERRKTDAAALGLRQTRRARWAAGDVRPFAEALSRPGLSLIAEHKRNSPSAGTIREDLSLKEVVAAFELGGAAALSILTEGPNFGGSLDDLREARAASTLPILRKDFIVDPFQENEAMGAGADAILLIVAALTEQELRDLHLRATGMGLSVLVEAHDERELDAALEIGARVVGINNRDLTTLKVDTRRAFDLVARVPDGVIKVAESGFSTPEELSELEAAGFDAVLMGEALMRAHDIEAACRALTAPTM
jgi:indole-3-glycerol phosphate synthase